MLCGPMRLSIPAEHSVRGDSDEICETMLK